MPKFFISHTLSKALEKQQDAARFVRSALLLGYTEVFINTMVSDSSLTGYNGRLSIEIDAIDLGFDPDTVELEERTST